MPRVEEPDSTLNIQHDNAAEAEGSDVPSPHSQITDDDYRQVMLSGTRVLDKRVGNKRSYLFDNRDAHICEEGAPTPAKARRPTLRKLGLDLDEAAAIAEVINFEHDSALPSAVGTPRNEETDEVAGKAADRAMVAQEEKPQEEEAVEILMGHLFPIAMAPNDDTNPDVIRKPCQEPARSEGIARRRQAEPRQGAAAASRMPTRPSEEIEEVAEVLMGHLFPVGLPPDSLQGTAVVGQPSEVPLKPSTAAPVHPSSTGRENQPPPVDLGAKQRLMGHLFPVHLSEVSPDPPPQEPSNPAAAHEQPNQPSSPLDAGAASQLDGLNAPLLAHPHAQRGSSRSLATTSSGISVSKNTSSNYSEAEFVPTAGELNLPGHSYPLIEPQAPILDQSSPEASQERPVPLIGHVTPLAVPSSSRPAIPPQLADPRSSGTLPNGNPEISPPPGSLHYPWSSFSSHSQLNASVRERSGSGVLIGHFFFPASEQQGAGGLTVMAPQSCEAVFQEKGEAAEVEVEGRLVQVACSEIEYVCVCVCACGWVGACV